VRRLILHIGLEKTGSTAFQAYCTKNRRRLAAAGVVYPAHPACFLGLNHAPLAASYFSAEEAEALLIAGRSADRREAIAALKAESAGAALTLISAEHLSSRFDPGRIHALAADLADYEVSVAVVVRDPVARARAAYATAVASGRALTLAAFVEELLAPGNGYLLSRAVIEAWSQVFGRERMIVAGYREGQDIVPALARRLIPGAAPETGGLRRNVSPPAAEIERQRRANAAMGLARWLARWRGRARGPALAFTPDEAARIEAHTAEDVAWLRREYGIEPSRRFGEGVAALRPRV